MNGYGAELPIHSDFGQGSLRTLVIDDNFANELPYPYIENVIEITKTGVGSVTFYVPKPINLPRGHCINFIYSNGQRDLVFENPPGELNPVPINGDIGGITFGATGGRQFFAVTCGDAGWRIEGVQNVKAGPALYFSDHVLTTFGSAPLTYEIDIPGMLIKKTGMMDSLDIKSGLVHQTNAPAGEFSIGWQQGGPITVMFTTQPASIPMDAWVEMFIHSSGPGGNTTQFYIVYQNAGGFVDVVNYSTAGIDLDADWEIVYLTDAPATTVDMVNTTYEAKRV